MIDKHSSEPYQTTDTSLAVYLYTEGFRIIDIDYSQDRAIILFKNDNAKIRDYERLYYISKAPVDASTYSRTHKRLSKIIRLKLTWTEGIING